MGKQLAVKLRIHARLSTTIKNLIKVQPVSSEMFEAAGTEKNMHCLIMKEIEQLEAKRRTLLDHDQEPHYIRKRYFYLSQQGVS